MQLVRTRACCMQARPPARTLRRTPGSHAHTGAHAYKGMRVDMPAHDSINAHTRNRTIVRERPYTCATEHAESEL
eukprot:6186339-Pleurochrysis_carterae.AAC.3